MEITIAYLGTAKRFQEFIRSEQERYPNAIARGKASLGIFFLKKDDIEIRYVFCSDTDKLMGLRVHFIEKYLDISFRDFRILETEVFKANRNLKELCKDAFLESFAYNGLHPTVELIQDLCRQFDVLETYKKAYEEYYG
jgi:hypothetical protein